jgi:hypothetical protein
MGGGTPSNTTSTQIQQLPDWLNRSGRTSQAQNLYQKGGPQYYPGNTVAPFSPMQEQYFSGVENLAQNGQPVSNAASNFTTQALNGGLMSQQNPYLANTFHQAAGAVQNQLGSEFAGSGRNPEASIGAQSDQMNQLANQIYGGAYNENLNATMGALGQSGQVAQQGLVGLNALSSAGGQLQGQAGAMQGANQSLYNYYAQLPYTNLSNYMNQVNSLSHGGSASSTQPFYGPSKTESALGGAASGAAMGATVGGPYGALIGGGIGLVGGYFGA